MTFDKGTKSYLLESLNKHQTKDINLELISKLQNINEVTGGAGVGGGSPTGRKTKPTTSAPKDPNAPEEDEQSELTMDDGILFGDSGINWAGAMGLYAGGKVLSSLADMAETGIGKMASGATKYALGKLPASVANLPIIGPAAALAAKLPPQLAGGMLRNLADLSGAGWFDANVKNIGANQLALAAQGAGKPWVPLQIPKGTERGEDPTDVALKQAKREEEITKYRNLGYKI